MKEERPELFRKDEYIISQKLLSVKDTYVIKDKNENEIGRAKRELISLGPKVRIFDQNDEKVGMLKGHFISFRNKTGLENWQEEKVGTLKQKLWKFIGTKYWIEDKTGERIMEIEGDFTGHQFNFFDPNGKKIAEVGEAWISLGDHYGIQLTEEGKRQDVDPFLILAAVLAIDTYQKKGGGSWLQSWFTNCTCCGIFVAIILVILLFSLLPMF